MVSVVEEWGWVCNGVRDAVWYSVWWNRVSSGLRYVVGWYMSCVVCWDALVVCKV